MHKFLKKTLTSPKIITQSQSIDKSRREARTKNSAQKMRNTVRATSAVNDRLRRPSGQVFSEAMSSMYSASSCSNARQKVINKTTPGADLGFYKGGCPIHLKTGTGGRAPPPNYFDPCYRNQTIFLALEKIVGARRSYDI